MPTNVLHGEDLWKIKKLPQESQGAAFYTILYNFLISLSSVEHLKNLKYPSFSCKTEDLLKELLHHF